MSLCSLEHINERGKDEVRRRREKTETQRMPPKARRGEAKEEGNRRKRQTRRSARGVTPWGQVSPGARRSQLPRKPKGKRSSRGRRSRRGGKGREVLARGRGGGTGGSPANSLVPAPVLAVAADQKFGACVNEDALARDPLLAVGHLGWGCRVNLIDAG